MKACLSRELDNEQLSISRKHLLSTCCILNPVRHLEDAIEREDVFK